MRARRGLVLAVALLAAALATRAPLRAQSDDEIQSALQWNLSTPGARSLALGGAFLAVADDATAAYANPAGLSQLARPEVSLEGRAWGFTSRFVDRGHRPATGVTGIGVDVVDGVQMGEREDRERGLSFASYVHSGRRGAWALYHHQLAQFAASMVSHGPFAGGRDTPLRAVPATSRLSLDIGGWGVAGAWRPRADLSVGATLSYQSFRLRSRTLRFDRRDRTGNPLQDALTGGFFGPADFLPANLLNTQTMDGDDASLTGSAGALWRPSARWGVGAVYRRGARFGFDAQFVEGPRGDQPGRVDPTVGGHGTFHVPDTFGVGVAWRPREDLVFGLDWDRVRYSQLSDHLVNLLLAARGDDERSFVIDDADEVHLGAEYQAITWAVPVAFRLGAWRDPDHRLRYTGHNPVLQARFAPGEDELHVAGGLGVVVGRAQVDVAVDLSRLVDTVSLSTVARF